MQFPRLFSINTSVCPKTNFTVSSIDVLNVVSWLLLLESFKQHDYRSLTFSRRSTTKCTTKPVGKILDKLAIVSEAVTASKAAFYSLFNSKSHNFSEGKTHDNASSKYDLFTLKNTLYSSRPWGRECLSPPSGLVSQHEQICWQKLRMRYRMSVIYGHPVVAASRALRFSDHVTKRNGGSGNENGVMYTCR